MYNRFFSTQRLLPIRVTNNAWKKITSIIGASGNHFLFSARGGGCNGFNYNMSLIDNNDISDLNQNKLKTLYVQKNGIKVFIDPMSEMYLLDTEIDYISEDIEKNIFENKFIFTPNSDIATSCGCGVSFSPK